MITTFSAALGARCIDVAVILALVVICGQCGVVSCQSCISRRSITSQKSRTSKRIPRGNTHNTCCSVCFPVLKFQAPLGETVLDKT